ncbi:hypothetical protein B296_00043247 [Ensete ventricosum]|uniref:Retrotransposon gag domain-containing protein n=1 Tax=Ensete ventricosum TaxID=4639 RepID=A0A426XL79_ENSVE|nr:hypothetical protein B296_00043247 [Ensete ventricosum]
MVTWWSRRRASDNWPIDVVDLTRKAGRTLEWGPQRSYDRPDTGKVDTLTCGRMSYRGCSGRADSQPLLEDDDRSEDPLTRIQPRVVHGHCRGFPRPHQPSPSISGNGADHSPVPAPARAFDGSSIGYPVTPTPARSQSRSYNPVPIELDFDTLSTDIADSLREQVRRVHQRLDEVQKKVLKSRGEVGESSKGGSSFTPEIQAKLLPALELYDGSGDPTKHIAAFRAQMSLYDTLDALMSKFLASARSKPTTTSLLGMAQGSDESLSQFVGWFTSQVQGIPDLHPSLAIQAFLTGLRPSRFFWSLIERPPATLPEMLERAHLYMTIETLIVGKREETKRPRGEQSRGHPAPQPKRREDRSGLLLTRPPLSLGLGDRLRTLRHLEVLALHEKANVRSSAKGKPKLSRHGSGNLPGPSPLRLGPSGLLRGAYRAPALVGGAEVPSRTPPLLTSYSKLSSSSSTPSIWPSSPSRGLDAQVRN